MNSPSNVRVRRSVSGFTLIELLVVVAIIGLLAALLFPVFAAARRSARMTTCTSNLHQIGLALQMYHSDWGRMPTEQLVDSFNHPNWKGHDPIAPYTKSGGIYHCPDAEAGLAGNYLYRGGFSLARHESGAPFVPDINRTIRLQPTSVLAYCQEHVTIGWQYQYTGTFIVLRADTAVQRIPGGRVATWGYHDKWIPPPLDRSLITRLFPVFPDEPWPPQFEE